MLQISTVHCYQIPVPLENVCVAEALCALVQNPMSVNSGHVNVALTRNALETWDAG